MTFAEFLPNYLEFCYRHKAPRTVRNFDEPALKSFAQDFGGLSIKKITPANIMFWESCLAQKYGKTTVRMRLRCIRAAFNWAKEMRFIKENPADNIRMPRPDEVGRVLKDWEIEKILERADPEFGPVVQFVLETGLRRGEVEMLDWTMYDRGRFILPSSKTKSRRPRIVPLSDKAKRCLTDQRLAGSVFRYTHNQLNHLLTSAAGRAGVGRVRFHDLRHTWATRLAETGISPWKLLDLGGWASLTSISPYIHLIKGNESAHAWEQNTLPKKESEDTLSRIFSDLSTFINTMRGVGLEPTRLSAYAPQTDSEKKKEGD